ncbi:uncharacterized protein LOC132268127 [Cornus florida]|uniref:uncharacterized protein LOC132268127 n=1 Tax=Cornus florida TaxID=4283 RepID=UPI0028A03E9B|nr:uncharacterized protein LOC132268127 [Cornus florida]
MMEVFKQVNINLPLLDAIRQIPLYTKFLKDLCTQKRKSKGQGPKKVLLTEQVSSIIQHNTPPKFKDPGAPTISCVIGNHEVRRAFLILGASVNLIPYSVYVQLGLNELKPTSVMLQLADRSIKTPKGMVKDILIKVDKFYFLVDFVVLDTEPVTNPTNHILIILGRPFLATVNATINRRSRVMDLSFGNMMVKLNVSQHPIDEDECCLIDILDEIVEEFIPSMVIKIPIEDNLSSLLSEDPLASCLLEMYENCGFDNEGSISEVNDLMESVASLNFPPWKAPKKPLPPLSSISLVLSLVSPPTIELKNFPPDLKYAFLGPKETLPVIISSNLEKDQENALLNVLKENKEAIGWSVADLKGINPSICMHRILMEDDVKPFRDAQRRLNPNMKEVVKKEVIKLLDAGIIYPISDSKWVSPTQVVPKKSGIMMVENLKGEAISKRTSNSWRVCIDYSKLNAATRKNHFPLPFIDKILERLAGKQYYCFLDGYSGFRPRENHIYLSFWNIYL